MVSKVPELEKSSTDGTLTPKMSAPSESRYWEVPATVAKREEGLRQRVFLFEKGANFV